MISANFSAIFYLISGILFILALRGLSSPDTSRQGNYFGIAGMIIAIVVTFLSVGNFSISLVYIIIFLIMGGSIGAYIAFKIPMTAMPELVAGFHSLVGLAAVFVAIAAFLNPEAFNLWIYWRHQIGKLNRNVNWCCSRSYNFLRVNYSLFKVKRSYVRSSYHFQRATFFKFDPRYNYFYFNILFMQNSVSKYFLDCDSISFLVGVLLIIPIGGADMPVVISMLNSYSGWAAAGIGFTLENTALIITGALVGLLELYFLI